MWQFGNEFTCEDFKNWSTIRWHFKYNWNVKGYHVISENSR